jgi:hypothetical protein
MYGGLLLCGRKRPDGARAVLTAKDKSKLLRRAQAVGMVRSERRTGLLLGQCAKQIAGKVAIGTARFSDSTTGHGDLSVSSGTTTAAIKPGPPESYKSASRKCRTKRFRGTKIPANCMVFMLRPRTYWMRQRNRASSENPRPADAPWASRRRANERGHGRRRGADQAAENARRVPDGANREHRPLTSLMNMSTCKTPCRELWDCHERLTSE